jgi:hypothetical protein
MHTFILGGQVTTGDATTVIVKVHVPVHPVFGSVYAYVITLGPRGAAAGLKIAIGAAPIKYVPPAGIAPANANAGTLSQTVILAGQTTLGSGFTIIVKLHVPVHPVAGSV